jgi:hypothetical protein
VEIKNAMKKWLKLVAIQHKKIKRVEVELAGPIGTTCGPPGVRVPHIEKHLCSCHPERG